MYWQWSVFYRTSLLQSIKELKRKLFTWMGEKNRQDLAYICVAAVCNIIWPMRLTWMASNVSSTQASESSVPSEEITLIITWMSAADRKDFQTLFILYTYTPNVYMMCVLEHKMFYIKRRGGKEVPTFSSNKVTQLECHVKYQRPLNSNQIIISDAASF